MLRIFYGELDSPKYIFNPDVFFNNTYEEEWIIDSLSKQMIKDIDGSEVKGARLIDSPFWGSYPYRATLRWSKDAYLMNFGDSRFNIEIVNINKIVHTMKELNEAVLDNQLI